ncbi:MAG TPA: DinB family protein [Blastocatellia bacterium]|nr:DinB family protein [Blastocatellia bacterium]
MTVKDLEALYDYGYWANKRLFEVLSQITPEDFTRQVAGTPASIRNLLVHAMSAEWGWLSKCGGPERGSRLEPNDYPTVDSVIETWSKVETWVRAFLSTLKDKDLDRQIAFTNERDESRSLPLGSIMQHAANHSVHHRGQISLLLRMLGKAPGNIDILIYYALKTS